DAGNVIRPLRNYRDTAVGGRLLDEESLLAGILDDIREILSVRRDRGIERFDVSREGKFRQPHGLERLGPPPRFRDKKRRVDDSRNDKSEHQRITDGPDRVLLYLAKKDAAKRARRDAELSC